MSSIGHGGGLRTFPRHRLHTAHNGTRSLEDDRVQLSLKAVIGTTTTSPNAFDSASDPDCFAYCAGPAVIVSQIHQGLNVTQRLFRARQNASSLNWTPSFYNPSTPPSTPTKSRHGSSFREGSFSHGGMASLEHISDFPGTGKPSNCVREATCVSLGRHSNLVAVGETGQNPRVLLFSTAQDAPADKPLSVLTDHSFGVQSVALSTDSRWLCSLGNAYDGFILLYSLNAKTGAAKLHSSNKCSNVLAIFWMGQAIISFGTRHVKLWRVEGQASPTRGHLNEATIPSSGSPGPKTFSGRNCILGSLIDATFTAGTSISSDKAFLATAQGDICLLDDTHKTQRLEKVLSVSFSVSSIHFDEDKNTLRVGGSRGQLETLMLEDFEAIFDRSSSLHFDRSIWNNAGIVAIGSVRNYVVTIGSDRVVDIREKHVDEQVSKNSQTTRRFQAHESAVLGVCSLLHWSSKDFGDLLTYSALGKALFWTLEGTCCGNLDLLRSDTAPLLLSEPNEVKVLEASVSSGVLILGDKMGVLSLVNCNGSVIETIQAHKGDINGIASAKTGLHHLICTCGRDRTLQLFESSSSTMNLLQTLDDHAASVTDVMFLNDASTLISVSSDRTVLVRKAACGEDGSLAFLPVRVITLKASPVSLAIVPFQANVVVLSTLDRQIHKFDISSGRLLQNFKAYDALTNDSVLLNSLQVATINSGATDTSVILAASSTDKSIRLHDYETGALLTHELGQKAVATVKLLQEHHTKNTINSLISCGLDGTVIVYNVVAQTSPQRYGTPSDSPVRTDLPLQQTPNSITQPVRKTLSKSEVADFQRALEQSEGDTVSPIPNTSPSRVRKKVSRYSLANAPRASVTGPVSASYMSGTDSFQRKLSQGYSPTQASPKGTIKASKPKSRPSLDSRHRSKSAANLNDFNVSAEQLCDSLRVFRRRLASSVADKLKPEVSKELRQELENTLQAMNRSNASTRGSQPVGEPVSSDMLDSYVAKMIDEQLTLRMKNLEDQTAITANEHARAGASTTESDDSKPSR